MFLFFLISCDKEDIGHDDDMDDQMHMDDDSGDDDNDNSNEEFDIERDSQAVIQNVIISGSEGDYSFNVEIMI